MELQYTSPQATTVVKAAYATPSLRRLGSLSELTAAGSAIILEQGNPGNCSQDTSRGQCR